MIDYKKIADSVDYFEKLKYKRIEAPWWVSEEIINLTKPKNANPIYYIPENKKCLVASGEQSFMYMGSKGRLPKGKYLTVTPCFRNEPIGILSKKCFIKTELINNEKVSKGELDNMVNNAFSFFKSQVPDAKHLKIVETKEGFDINYFNIEIGSYGIRKFDFMEWIFGTGCAEPRLTRSIKKYLTNR